MGNPGDSGKADVYVSAAYDSLRGKLLRNQSSDPQGITDEKVSLTIPTYEGDNEKLRSMIDDPDGNDNYSSKSQVAAKELVATMELTSKKCPGSHTVFVGHDFGAAAIRLAAHSLTPEQTSRVSGVWLMADPSRDVLDDEVATFNGASSDPIIGDATAGGTLKFYGIRGTGYGFSADLKDKVLTVCFPDDLECNQDMDFVWHKEKFIASHGGSLAALHVLKTQYTDAHVNVTASGWVASRVWKDVDAARATNTSGTSQGTSASPLQKYLEYVNQDAAGAQVIQDEVGHPENITSCEADYAVIALRGSGERIDGNDYDQNGDRIEYAPVDGVIYTGGRPAMGGPIIDAFTAFPATAAWKIKMELPSDKKIRFIPVKYAAVGLDKSFGSGHIQSYFDSATQGASMLQNKVLELAAKCPQTKIILMGYSQGAQAVHQTLHGTDRSTAEKISGVLLIADPLRRGDDPIPLPYDAKDNPDAFAPKGSGLYSTNGIMAGTATLWRLGLSKDSYAIPDYFSNKVVEICDLKDVVCNGGHLLIR
jgi:predicted alpha/beta hydrolase family esterase